MKNYLKSFFMCTIWIHMLHPLNSQMISLEYFFTSVALTLRSLTKSYGIVHCIFKLCTFINLNECRWKYYRSTLKKQPQIQQFKLELLCVGGPVVDGSATRADSQCKQTISVLKNKCFSQVTVRKFRVKSS